MAIRLHEVWRGQCPLLGPSLYVWVQGCPRRCPGCFNQAALEESGPALAISPQALAELWQGRGGGGIVLSGGEPFAQAEGLAAFCRLARQIQPATPVLVYTGYRLDELLLPGQDSFHALLRQADVLVDGPFVQSRLTSHALVGSDNQRIFLLGSRVCKTRLDALNRPHLQVGLTLDGQMRLVGTGNAAQDMNALIFSLAGQCLVVEAK